MLRAVGFTDADFTKPQVGIASTGSKLTPCNMHINGLADAAAMGADEAGGKAVIFHTITVADGISMGSPGMRYSLVSREVIADSIETVVGAEGLRRVRRDRRLRQEHAGLRDRDGADGPAERIRLRRLDQNRQRTPRRDLGVRSGRRTFREPASPTRN